MSSFRRIMARFGAAVVSTALLVPATARGEVRSEPIEYELGGTTFRGHAYWDDAVSGRRPGVLVVHEWWGCNEFVRDRAAALAALGYVAFACDMYGDGRTTTDAAEASAWAGAVYGDRGLLRARATAALQQLAGFRFADPERLAAIGYCFGGTVVLELARSGAQVRAVASFHGGLGTTMRAEPGAILAEVLVLNGAEDPLVEPAERQAFMQEMRESRARWTFVEVGGAVHSFTNPQAGRMGNPAVAFDARAERQSWGMLRELLARRFSE